MENANTLAGALRRSIPLWILILGHVFSSLFLRNLGEGLGEIDDATVRNIAMVVKNTSNLLLYWFIPPLVLMVLFAQVRIVMGKRTRWVIDLLGGLLILRCSFQFVMLNLLLLSHLKAGGLLLLQLILFIPVITVAFGWLYWRLDTAGRARGHAHIRFAEEMGALDTFDYYHVSAMTLLQFEPSGATPLSRLMKTLFVIHGIMMLDLVALTLSRAIGLASGG